jgi:Zn-dependent protease with chaperone function
MNYKFYFWLILFSSISLLSYGQDFNDYKPLQASGKIPEDFTKLSSQKYIEDKQNIDKNDKRRTRMAQDKFYLESNFKVDEILLSGKILFNDPISQYVNKVADKLLENNPELRKKIRIYVVKSAALNAFASNNGIIFINLGLISQLENEAQLAFVISHEITHFEKKHALNSYVETSNIKNGRGVYKKLSVEEQYFAKNNYSKELESEADLYGLNIYSNSDYTKAAIPTVFNVLHYGYLPFDDIPFDTDYFNTEYVKVPLTYFLEATAEIKSDENYDDSKSTHPNTDKRRSAILDKIEELQDNKALFLVSKEEFINVRKLSRFEIARIYLLNKEYEAAIYHTYLLLKKDPDSKYLKKCMVKALYGIAKYKNASRSSYVHVNFQKIEGASQQVYHFFEKIDASELTVITLVNLWKLKKEYPEDTELRLITDDLFRELVIENKLTPQDFYSKTKETIRVENNLDSLKSLSTDSLSKYDKIKNKSKILKIESEGKFTKYAFVGLLKDEEFKNKFNNLVEENKVVEEKDKVLTYKERRKIRTNESANRDRIKRRGYAMGLNKVVIVNPFYYRIDERKKNSVRYQASERGQQALDDQIKENAKLLKLDIDLVDPNSVKEDDVDNFNDNLLLQDWLSEKLEHDDINLVSPIHEDILKVADKHGTMNFCWMGLLSTTNKKPNKGSVLALTIMTVYALPYGIYYVVTPEHRTYFYNLLYNIETGEMTMSSIRKLYARDSKPMIHSHIYFTLFQLKNKRK